MPLYDSDETAFWIRGLGFESIAPIIYNSCPIWFICIWVIKHPHPHSIYEQLWLQNFPSISEHEHSIIRSLSCLPHLLFIVIQMDRAT